MVTVGAPAIAIALSPIPVVITLVLLVHNARPRASSIAYLAGRATALTTLPIALLNIPQLGDSLHRIAPEWVKWIAVVVGGVFIAVGARIWRHREPAPATSTLHHRFGGIPPTASAALGLFPPLLNPKTIAASIAVDTQIHRLPTLFGTTAALACYVVVASSTVAAPIAAYLALGPRIGPQLEHLRQRVQHHRDTITATTLILIGAAIVLYALL